MVKLLQNYVVIQYSNGQAIRWRKFNDVAISSDHCTPLQSKRGGCYCPLKNS